ncbi:MAG: SDR family oxidoreductase [Acidimicrobiia bacterium]|jgi:NAD(P)-dependent dehydrogenase (short-subunit alcohol dehydrogenase family)
MSGRLQGKVCIVTGGAQGIGAAYAVAMAAEGADVAVFDLKRIDQATEVEAAIAALGRRSLALRADVTDADQMREAVATVVGELGRVDCLVNNAALMFDQLTATWDEFLAVNFMGIVNASNAVVPYLWEQGSGSIVNISSTAAFPIPLPDFLRPGPDSPAPRVDPSGYGITKWMVIFQTRHMAQMLGVKNIRVNAVAPGVTMSPATKAVVPEPIIDALAAASALHTTLEPEDMTGVVVFLASDESSKMTGQVLINDAGTWFSG